MPKKRVHRIRAWLMFLNSYDPSKDSAYTYCGAIVKGKDTNLRTDADKVTCKKCLK